ncbi:MAG: hypothetical protein JRE16_09530 [Deltaproteobacteria bacterium]|jgi:hypothetical protein|nr:hypothetical protein [Deltaproteobacteria bacterium]
MEIHLNLASRPYLNRRIVQRWLFVTCGTLLLVFTANMLYGLQNHRQMNQLETRLADLDKQMAELQGLPDDYSPQKHALVMQDLAVVKQIVTADQFQWTHTLSRLEILLPDDVSIISLQPDYRERTLQVKAVAKTVSAMTEFLDQLLSSEDLNQAFLLNQAETLSQASSQSLINFGLVIREAF